MGSLMIVLAALGMMPSRAAVHRLHATQMRPSTSCRRPALVASVSDGNDGLTGEIVELNVVEGETRALTVAEQQEVGNLVADDEWLGLTMEMAIVVRSAVRESAKASIREFTGKDHYEVGDLSKAADARIKDAVAALRVGMDRFPLSLPLSTPIPTIRPTVPTVRVPPCMSHRSCTSHRSCCSTGQGGL